MSYTLRPATQADIPQLIELRAVMLASIDVQDTETTPWRESYARLLREQLGSADLFAVVAVDDASGQVGAGAMATVSVTAPRPSNVSGRIAWLTNVATFPDFRGRGIAQACCEEVLAWCRDEAKVGVVHLNATDMGRGIYERVGFRDVKYPEMRLSLLA